MKKLVNSTESKYLKKMLRNKDFVFTMICYPIILMLYLILKSYLNDFKFEVQTGFWYTILSFVALLTLLIVTIYERVNNKLYIKGQGAKLKLKQQDGNWKN